MPNPTPPSAQSILAAMASYYAGTALWHGRRRALQVLETDDESLVGMSLLEGSDITIQARAGGSVLIEEDTP